MFILCFKAWKPLNTGIRVEGPLLTYVATESKRQTDQRLWAGARYRKPFSAEFPYFEVSNGNAWSSS